MTQIELPAVASAVPRAREAVATLRLPEPPEAHATLLVSELVTNCVKHAALGPDDRISLRIRRNGRLRVEVCDPGAGFEPSRRRERPVDEPGGWGLVLVQELAERWGMERDRDGTCVWFELPVGASATG